MKRTIFGLTTALSVTAFGAAYADEVNLYTSNSEDSVAMALDVIRAEAPDIQINVISGGSGELLRRIEAEQGAPVADLFWSSGFSTLEGFSDLFVNYDSTGVADLVPALQANDDPWAGTNTHVMVFMVNESQLDGQTAPTTWEDIMDESWTGRVTMADPANSSSAYAQLYGVWTLYGEDGVRNLANVVEMQGSTSGAYTSVARGEFPVGITMEYAAQRYVAGGQDEIALVYPSDGTFLSPEGLALITGGSNPDAARIVYDLFLSQEMQGSLFEITFRRPSRGDLDDVIQSTGLPTMDEINIIDIDQGKAGADRDMLLALWAEARG